MPEPRKIDKYICKWKLMYDWGERAGQTESGIPVCYHTYIVQVRDHARLQWVAMRSDEMRSVDGWQLGAANSAAEHIYCTYTAPYHIWARCYPNPLEGGSIIEPGRQHGAMIFLEGGSTRDGSSVPVDLISVYIYVIDKNIAYYYDVRHTYLLFSNKHLIVWR